LKGKKHDKGEGGFAIQGSSEREKNRRVEAQRKKKREDGVTDIETTKKQTRHH